MNGRDDDGDSFIDCQDPGLSTDPACGMGSGGVGLGGPGVGMGAINISLCTQWTNNMSNCTAQMGSGSLAGQSICYFHNFPGQSSTNATSGMCDPIFNRDIGSSSGLRMEQPPVFLEPSDSIADVAAAANNYLNFAKLGMMDNPNAPSFAIGLGIVNLTNFAGTAFAYSGSANMSGKYVLYLDTDGNSTNGNPADNNASLTGFDYKVVFFANSTSGDVKIAYKAGSWIPAALQITVDKAMVRMPPWFSYPNCFT